MRIWDICSIGFGMESSLKLNRSKFHCGTNIMSTNLFLTSITLYTAKYVHITHSTFDSLVIRVNTNFETITAGALFLWYQRAILALYLRSFLFGFYFSAFRTERLKTRIAFQILGTIHANILLRALTTFLRACFAYFISTSNTFSDAIITD